jgi:hypothetical protein
MTTKITLPGQSEPFVIQGGLINPVWYEKLKAIAAAINGGVLGSIDVDNSTPITNGQTLIYNSTTKKLAPGAN